jgi:hypothetical protein
MTLYGTVAPGSAAIRYTSTGEPVVTFTLTSDGGTPVEVQVKGSNRHR